MTSTSACSTSTGSRSRSSAGPLPPPSVPASGRGRDCSGSAPRPTTTVRSTSGWRMRCGRCRPRRLTGRPAGSPAPSRSNRQRRRWIRGSRPIELGPIARPVRLRFVGPVRYDERPDAIAPVPADHRLAVALEMERIGHDDAVERWKTEVGGEVGHPLLEGDVREARRHRHGLLVEGRRVAVHRDDATSRAKQLGKGKREGSTPGAQVRPDRVTRPGLWHTASQQPDMIGVVQGRMPRGRTHGGW